MKLLLPGLLLVVALSAIGVFWGSYSYFRGEELAKAEARLSLYRSTVTAELQRFSHLPYVLARDPNVIDTARGDDPTALDSRLAAFAERDRPSVIDVMVTRDPARMLPAVDNRAVTVKKGDRVA